MNKEIANKIAVDIMFDLSERKGFDLHELDDDIKTEIKDAWTAIIMEHVAALTPAAPDSENDAVLEGDVYHIEYVESDKIVLTRCQ